MSDASRFAVGDRVTWTFVPRDGPQEAVEVEGEVVRVTRLRVWIRVRLPDGQVTQRLVAPDTLRRRRE